MEWVDGETLLDYVFRVRRQPAALGKLREQLAAFAEEAERCGYAHGDVQHRNIIVASDGNLRFVDYDGMFVPALKGLQAADNGHPHFQSPRRTPKDFGVYMDRFPLAVIDLSLEALARSPQLFDDFHLGENLILSRHDFTDPAASRALNAIASIPGMAARVAALADFCRLSPREVRPLQEFRKITAGPPGPKVPGPSPPPSAPPVYVGPYDVVDGMNYAHASKFVGKQIELIGQVLQVRMEPKYGIVLLRFGYRYRDTPTVVVPCGIFSNLPGKNLTNCWVSVRGVLRSQKWHVFYRADRLNISFRSGGLAEQRGGGFSPRSPQASSATKSATPARYSTAPTPRAARASAATAPPRRLGPHLLCLDGHL